MESLVKLPLETKVVPKEKREFRWEEIYESRISEEIPLRILNHR